MAPTDCPETSVTNYKRYVLPAVSDDLRYSLLCTKLFAINSEPFFKEVHVICYALPPAYSGDSLLLLHDVV